MLFGQGVGIVVAGCQQEGVGLYHAHHLVEVFIGHAGYILVFTGGRFLPLTGFTYGELDTGSFAKLTPCPYCNPVQRKAEIDEENRAMGLTTPQSTSQQASASAEEEEAQAVPAMADMDETEVHIQIKDGP